MSIERIKELAGVICEVMGPDLSNQDIERLDYLLGYFIKGWAGFPAHPDPDTEDVMVAIQHLQGRNLHDLSPDEVKMAHDVLNYGMKV